MEDYRRRQSLCHMDSEMIIADWLLCGRCVWGWTCSAGVGLRSWFLFSRHSLKAVSSGAGFTRGNAISHWRNTTVRTSSAGTVRQKQHLNMFWNSLCHTDLSRHVFFCGEKDCGDQLPMTTSTSFSGCVGTCAGYLALVTVYVFLSPFGSCRAPVRVLPIFCSVLTCSLRIYHAWSMSVIWSCCNTH